MEKRCIWLHHHQDSWCTHVSGGCPPWHLHVAGHLARCLWSCRTWLWAGQGDLGRVRSKLHACGWTKGPPHSSVAVNSVIYLLKWRRIFISVTSEALVGVAMEVGWPELLSLWRWQDRGTSAQAVNKCLGLVRTVTNRGKHIPCILGIQTSTYLPNSPPTTQMHVSLNMHRRKLKKLN